MSGDLFARAKTLFQRAMDKPPVERRSFVAMECGEDAELQHEVMSWIDASSEAGSAFLNVPAVKMCMTCAGSFGSATKFCPHCGQVLQEDARALIGTRLDNLYQIEELLGQGGMGAVYRARHALLGDTVAIKTLKRELSDNPTFLKRFQREGKAARAFRHPNAVTVHDLRTTPAGQIFMVLEYVEGSNLRALLGERRRFTPAETVEILAPVASVIDAAHSKGVVHRDLKPENIMIAKDAAGGFVVKVLDLGIAKLRENLEEKEVATQLTAVGTLLGTPHYMSPEQWGSAARDGNREIDGRADVYSMGIMAFELVCGRWPYSGDTVDDFHKAHTTEPVPLAHEAARGVPGRFGKAIARAMAKDRADRFASPGAFVEALRESARDEIDDGSHEIDPAISQVPTMFMNAGDTMLDAPVNTEVDAPSAKFFAGSGAATVASDGQRKSGGSGSRTAAKMAIAGLAAVVLVVGIVLVYRATSGNPSGDRPPDRPQVEAPVPPSTSRVLSIAIDLRDKSGAERLVSGRDPVGPIDGYRFKFSVDAAGRLALIGPNTRNIPTLFLSTDSGPLAAGASREFPSGTWFGTTADTPSDTVTVVFIPDGAVVPAFAAGAAGRQLSVDEQKDFAAFRQSNSALPVYGDAASTISAADATRPLAADLTIRY